MLSKRLHSVFVLRLFNDGVAALAMWGAILLFMNRKWTAGVIVWSSGVAVKMTLLLLAPAIAAVTVLSLGLVSSLWLGILAVLVQVYCCCFSCCCSRAFPADEYRFYWLFPFFSRTL